MRITDNQKNILRACPAQNAPCDNRTEYVSLEVSVRGRIEDFELAPAYFPGGC